MNKTTSHVKLDHLSSSIKHLRCEQGLKQVEWVNFDQINNAVMEEWTFMEGHRSFRWINLAWK